MLLILWIVIYLVDSAIHILNNRGLIFTSLFEASAVDVPSLHWFWLQCVVFCRCLCTFEVAELTTLPSLC